MGSIPEWEWSPWRKVWQPTSVFLPGVACGQRSLWATVHGVVKGRTWLKQLSIHQLMRNWAGKMSSQSPEEQAKQSAQFSQFSSDVQSCLTLCNPMNRSTPGLPVHHQLLEFTKTHIHWVGDAIQPSHPLSSPSPPAVNLSQHQGLLQWVNSSHEMAKVLEFYLQHQAFQ